MQCSRKLRAFIYGGIAACGALVLAAPFTSARVAPARDAQIVASQLAQDPNFKKLDETSGIAIAGFRDARGSPLLWAHNEKTTRISLVATRQSESLYVGAVTMPGPKTRDAEDIAAVDGTIYLADTGANRKDLPGCIRFFRDAGDPAHCRVRETELLPINPKLAGAAGATERACLARGDDRLWLPETDRLAPGAHPSIRRLREPTYSQALRNDLATDTATIEFDYPRECGARPCLRRAGGQFEAGHAAHNTEALAVVVEPDHSHTAYLFTKSPHSLANALAKQHPQASACRFDADGLSEVFRIRHIDSLSPGAVHRAEYVATLDLSADSRLIDSDGTRTRVTAANFLGLSAKQGLLLLRTKGYALKWPVGLGRADAGGSATFDVAGALQTIKPVLAAAPESHKKQGVSKKNQEAAAQLDASTIYYMGECKRLPACSVAMVHDDHPYLAGDVDGDGRVDANDLGALREYLAHRAALYCLAAADVDGDGRVDTSDLTYLGAFLDGRGPAPRPSLAHTALGCGYYRSASR